MKVVGKYFSIIWSSYQTIWSNTEAITELNGFLSQCIYTAAAAAKSLQSCPTPCDPIDSSPPGSAVPGILQARTVEWVAISFSNAWKWKVKVKSLSHVWPTATPWTTAYQAPPSMGFSRQEYWSGVPLPSPFSALIISKDWLNRRFHSFFRVYFKGFHSPSHPIFSSHCILPN